MGVAPDNTEWIWNHVRLLLPSDWEMLQFSRDPRTGRCGFADRFGFRLELMWRRVPGQPEYARVLSDYAARLTQDGAQEVGSARCGEWEGLEALQGDLRTTRYGRYLRGEALFVELVFLWPERRDAVLERTVLDSLRAEPPLPHGERRWRAFGVELRVPQACQLTACNVVSGKAEWTFRQPEASETWRFVRLGMVAEWLHEDIGAWLPRQTLPRMRPAGTWRHTVAGHDVHAWQGFRAPSLLRRGRGVVFGRLGSRLEAWRCPADGRLYLAEHTAPRRDPSAVPLLFGNRLLCEDAGITQAA